MKSDKHQFRSIILSIFMLFAFSASPLFAASVVWEDDFTGGVTTGADEHTVWDTFVTELSGAGTTNSVTMSGSQDTTGITCSDPTATKQIADLITSHTTGTVACDGHDWHYCVRFGETFDFWLDPPSSCSPQNCPSPGYLVRPKQQNLNWGGINGPTCNAESQSMRLEFGGVAIAASVPIPAMSTWALLLMATLLMLMGLRIRRTN